MLTIEKLIKLSEHGREFIYIYYYPTYREMAFMNDVVLWPCKIGRTDQHPAVRVKQQLNSCAPELPVIACVFQCDNSRALESTIHNYMKFHNRFLEHSFNQEWFNTNPDEVIALIETLSAEPDEVWHRRMISMVDIDDIGDDVDTNTGDNYYGG